MAFPGYSDIVASTMENRSSEVADAVSNNNAIFYTMKQKGRIKTFDGGRTIMQNLAFAENGNATAYSGYDELPVGVQDVLTAAEYPIKQYAAPVTMSGLEDLQNSGKEQIFDLMEARMEVAENTLINLLTRDMHGDGTGFGGKALTGLLLAMPTDPTTGTYGGINRALWPVWRPRYTVAAGVTAATVLGVINAEFNALVRMNDKPDLIAMGDTIYGRFEAAIQVNQRFENPKLAEVGFTTLLYKGATVVLDGGMGGAIPTGDVLFLNTKYLWLRPHSRRNMVPIGKERQSVNQDAVVNILGWAGNLTGSNAKMHGRLRTT